MGLYEGTMKAQFYENEERHWTNKHQTIVKRKIEALYDIWRPHDASDNQKIVELRATVRGIQNRKIEELCDSPDLHDKLGIQPQRLEDAMFDTDDKIARLQANCGANGVRLSQSDLARFVIEYMSPETCRTVVKVLAEAGYLHLTNSPFGAVLVASNGRLEEIYGEHIRSLRRALESISRLGGRDAAE